jgi:type III restriction enzyme
VEISAMNNLETTVGDLLDKQNKILWWFRNRVNRQSYAFQGWREGKIYPDFVAAKKSAGGKLELVYVVESKGEHLLGNNDTEYKKSVMARMNEQHEAGKVKKVQQTDLFALNEHVEFQFVEQGQEDAALSKLFQ